MRSGLGIRSDLCGSEMNSLKQLAESPTVGLTNSGVSFDEAMFYKVMRA